MGHFISPQPSLSLPCFLLILPELIKVLKGELCISMAVTLLDDLSIEEGTVQEINIGQQHAVLIPLLQVIFQSDWFAFNHLPGEGK